MRKRVDISIARDKEIKFGIFNTHRRDCEEECQRKSKDNLPSTIE